MVVTEKKTITENVPLDFYYKGKKFKGIAEPQPLSCRDGACFKLNITLNNEKLGVISCESNGWKMTEVTDQKFVDAIGQEIFLWYE
jgi:hypothetical protein